MPARYHIPAKGPRIVRYKEIAMTPEEILALGRKFMEPRILLTAAELDVFTPLAKKPMTDRVVAAGIQAAEPGIMILLDALVSMGLLVKR